MTWVFNQDRPIYLQLVEQLEQKIISGFYQPGIKLPSVRDLAAEASVNPNTMQKALASMEERGLVSAKRTSGRFITDDQSIIEKIKDNLAFAEIRQFLDKMAAMGFNRAGTVNLINKMGTAPATAPPERIVFYEEPSREKETVEVIELKEAETNDANDGVQ